MSSITELLKLLEDEVQAAEELDTLLEDKGNLKDIPDAWMKIVTKSYGALGGKDSEITELAQCKNVSKFRDGLIGGMKRDDLQAIFVTVNDGPFALVYKKSSYSGARPTYSIVAVDGEKTKTQKARTVKQSRMVRSEYSKKGYYTTYDRRTMWYEQDDMPMSTLLLRLQQSIADVIAEDGENKGDVFDQVFKKATIKISGITIDKNREETRKGRAANKPTSRDGRDGIQADLNAADKKYLKKKAGEVGKVLQDEVVKSLEGVTSKIVAIMDEAADGKVIGRINFSAELKEIQEKIDNISRLASAISDCVKRDGNVELVSRWKSVPEKSWSFQSLIDVLKHAQKAK